MPVTSCTRVSVSIHATIPSGTDSAPSAHAAPDNDRIQEYRRAFCCRNMASLSSGFDESCRGTRELQRNESFDSLKLCFARPTEPFPSNDDIARCSSFGVVAASQFMGVSVIIEVQERHPSMRGTAVLDLRLRIVVVAVPNLVRKLFKKIGQDVAARPELAPDLIEPFKS